MLKKIENYVNDQFMMADDNLKEIKEEIIYNLQEKYKNLVEEGMSADDAYNNVILSIGDIQELIDSNDEEQLQNIVTLSGSMLDKSDFSEIVISDSNFDASSIKHANFSHSKISRSTYRASDLSNCNFESSYLDGNKYKASALENCSFKDAILEKVEFTACDLQKVNFSNAQLRHTKITACALETTNFENSSFASSKFKTTDLRNVSFDNTTLIGVEFNKCDIAGATFNGAIIKNCSFYKHSKLLFSKHHTNVKKANFDGASMDKITYAALKGLDVNLENVTII